jgi:hypothetical protein
MFMKLILNDRFGMSAGNRHVTGGQEAADWIVCLCQLD